MTSRFPTDAFGRAIGNTGTTQSRPAVDTSSFLPKSGGTMTGNITLGSNRISTTSNPESVHDIPNKEYAGNAGNIYAGTLNKDRLPTTHNTIALNKQQLNFDKPNEPVGMIGEKTYGGRTYAHLDGKQGLLFTVGRSNEYMNLSAGEISCRNRNVTSVKTLTFNELKSDNSTEPIIINDTGLTLDDHTLRMRGPTDNDTSLRWFNGDLVNGEARVDLSSGERVRLSLLKGKDGQPTMKDGKRDYRSPNSQYVELLYNNFNMNRNRITNVVDPVADTDAATKAYVDSSSSGSPPLFIDKVVTGSSSVQTLTLPKSKSWTYVVVIVKLYESFVTTAVPRKYINKDFEFRSKGDGLPYNSAFKYNYYAYFRLTEASDTAIKYKFYNVGYITDGAPTEFRPRNDTTYYAIQGFLFF